MGEPVWLAFGSQRALRERSGHDGAVLISEFAGLQTGFLRAGAFRDGLAHFASGLRGGHGFFGHLGQYRAGPPVPCSA